SPISTSIGTIPYMSDGSARGCVVFRGALNSLRQRGYNSERGCHSNGCRNTSPDEAVVPCFLNQTGRSRSAILAKPIGIYKTPQPLINIVNKWLSSSDLAANH